MKVSTAAELESASVSNVGAGSQTLMRGLDVIEALSGGVLVLSDLADNLGLTKSTTHRLASALTDRGYLAFTPRAGYRLGPKLLELGSLAQRQSGIVQIARPHIEALSAASDDTVHLGVLDGHRALYLDKIPGRRRITISSRIGERQPLTSTGLGKALLLDHKPGFWIAQLEADQEQGSHPVDPAQWHQRMADYVKRGCAYDLEENEDQIRCVAAPVRDANDRIVAAVSVSCAAQYMSNDRMETLSDDVKATAAAISRDLGWAPQPAPGSNNSQR